MIRKRARLVAVIAIWVVPALATALVEPGQGADRKAGESASRPLPVAEKPLDQWRKIPTTRSAEPAPRFPDPSVTRKITMQPTVTGVIPHLIAPGNSYKLLIQGQALTQQMVLDFGPGITIIAGSLKVGTGPEGVTASVTVQVAPGAEPGVRTVRLAAAAGQPLQVQPAKLVVFVEPQPTERGPSTGTLLK